MDQSLETELEKAKDLAKRERSTEALLLLDQLASQYPHDAWVLATRAYVLGREGDTEGAIRNWSDAIAICAQEPHFFFIRGIELLKIGKFHDSVADFTKAISLSEEYESIYYKLPAYLCRADANARLRNFIEARRDCESVPSDLRFWTDHLITKEEVLSRCV